MVLGDIWVKGKLQLYEWFLLPQLTFPIALPPETVCFAALSAQIAKHSKIVAPTKVMIRGGAKKEDVNLKEPQGGGTIMSGGTGNCS